MTQRLRLTCKSRAQQYERTRCDSTSAIKVYAQYKPVLQLKTVERLMGGTRAGRTSTTMKRVSDCAKLRLWHGLAGGVRDGQRARPGAERRGVVGDRPRQALEQALHALEGSRRGGLGSGEAVFLERGQAHILISHIILQTSTWCTLDDKRRYSFSYTARTQRVLSSTTVSAFLTSTVGKW